ncbi:MAG TPA: alpha/beta hydrolase [Chondromyces sp.]|nr:alpha/beta hydrolase [Chondromyces sp.]
MDLKQVDYIQLNGIRLLYHFDENPHANHTLVLLHGFLSSSFSFRKLIPLLKEHYSVLTVDWPPFGFSEKPKSFEYSYQNIAKTMIELIQKLNLTSVILVGHSMGGQLAMQILKYAPNIAEKGILICGSSYVPRVKKRLIASSYLPFFSVFLKKWLEKTGVTGNLQSVVFDQKLINQEMIDGYQAPFENKEIFPGLIRFIRHREGDLPSEDIQKIQTPCLLIWGEHDRIVPLETAKKLTDDLPNSSLVIIKEAGHLVPEEKPEEVFRHINKFLVKNTD